MKRTPRQYLGALRRYPRHLGPWLARTEPVAVCASILLACLFVGKPFGAAFLDLAGLGLVMSGLIGTAEAFGQPTVRSRIRSWWQDRPPVWQRHVIEAGTGQVNIEGHSAGFSLDRASVTLSVEERVAALEKSLRRVDGRVTAVDDRVTREVQQLEGRIEIEAAARASLHAEITGKLEDFAVGDWDYQIVGVVWLGAGLLIGLFAGTP